MSEDMNQETITLPAVRSTKGRSLALGLVILLCGVVIGNVVTLGVLWRHEGNHRPRGGPQLPERIAERMRGKYGLSDEQSQKIKQVFAEHAQKLSTIRAEVQPRIDSEHAALRQGVEAILTPEQAAQWIPEYEKIRGRWHDREDASTKTTTNKERRN